MQPNAFSVNSALRPQVFYLGQEATPLIVIDDFSADVAACRQAAQQADFQVDAKAYYPGIKAPLPKDYVAATLTALYPLLYDVYKVPTQLRLKPHNLFYALINNTEQQLKPLQCIPHFDTTSPSYIAILHYLNEQPHGSTGFFRHIPTGFERINEQRRQPYFEKAQQHIDQYGSPEQQYFVQTDHHYQLYHQVAYQANRLIIYPGNALHSTLVDKLTDIDSSPVSGRLTANLFVDFL